MRYWSSDVCSSAHVRAHVDDQPAVLQDRPDRTVRTLLTGPAQHRPHTGDDLRWRRGLHDVVVGAQPEAPQLVVVAAEGAQHEHRHLRTLAAPPHHVEAPRPRTHPLAPNTTHT